MGVTVVILLEGRRSRNHVQAWISLVPWFLMGLTNPLEVLGEHRINHAQECFIACEQTMPASQRIAFIKAFRLVF